MVNGNYILYGDKPSSESAIVDDHVHSRNDRRFRRKSHRTANELQQTLDLAQLDNDTDSVKYEKKVMEPKLLRYVPNNEVEENFVTEQFETYDLKATEERPKRHTFTKKPKNPADGSANYGYSPYSRSSSGCSSPNANLPTISEHGEQYGTYRVRAMPSPAVHDYIAGYDTKLDKYFSKPREVKPFAAKGSHPDSLYRVAAESSAKTKKLTHVLRLLRWPIALVTVCIALAVFVYFLMPDNLESGINANGTFWEAPVAAGVGLRGQVGVEPEHKKKFGIKTSEIDFYNAEDDKSGDSNPVNGQESEFKKLPVPPVFPTHLTPEVQYGNEKADSEKRKPKFLETTPPVDSTLKPHITHKPEKPLAIYFKDVTDTTTATTETITRAETVNDFTNYDHKQANKQNDEYPVKTHPYAYKEYIVQTPKDYITQTEPDIYRDDFIAPELGYPPETSDIYNHGSPNVDVNFTSGHSKLFGISIEDAEKMKSTTPSALYNTRVSPTLPTWRDRDDTTTKKYPTNIYSEVQCKSTRLPLCRGVLPYDLASAPMQLGDVEITSLMSQIDYLVATNCSDRVKHFVCALLEPECSPPPHPTKMPCYNLCKAIVDSCDGHIPRELISAFDCKQFSHSNCVAAKTPCYAREFTCNDGSCIPQDWICDGRKDCPAGDDEQKCKQCDNTEFKCPTGGCIQKKWMCDGYKDCPGGEDESERKCGAQHVLALDENGDEPGEESAGSAPAPLIKRPNKGHSGHRKQPDAKEGEASDVSQELLVTSYSHNARSALRTFTPSTRRLMPYNHSSPQSYTEEKFKKNETRQKVGKPEVVVYDSKASEKYKALFEEEPRDPQMEDFYEDSVKEPKAKDLKSLVEGSKSTPARTRAFPGKIAVRYGKSSTKPPTHLVVDKEKNNFNLVIDGGALLRKAHAEAAEMEKIAELEKEEYPTDYKQGSHTSPCPSGELRCVDGHCITLAQLCDGTLDCSDHADEDNCYT